MAVTFLQLQWKSDRVLIRPEDEDDWENAEEILRIEVEGVEFYDFTGSIYEFNVDTQRMAEVGYRGFFVPGGGIVVENPDTPVALAAGVFTACSAISARSSLSS